MEDHVEYAMAIGTPVVAAAYGARFLPQTFLIRHDGTILSRTFGIRDKASLDGDVRKATLLLLPSRSTLRDTGGVIL